VEALIRLAGENGVNLIQLRNLSIDPGLYWQAAGVAGPGMGMMKMMARVRERIPSLQFGYFNRTRENFGSGPKPE
jgi:hypothetical protein